METKQSHSGWDRGIGRVVHGAHAVFGQKLLNTQRVVWAGALINQPSWNGQTHWKSLQKYSLKPNTASHDNASWCTDTDGFLEHSPSRGSLYYKGPALQKKIPLSGGTPSKKKWNPDIILQHGWTLDIRLNKMKQTQKDKYCLIQMRCLEVSNSERESRVVVGRRKGKCGITVKWLNK